MRILIIEDDLHLSKVLKMSFESEGYAVDTVSDGQKGSYEARTNDYDAIILDHVLPSMHGPEIRKEIRKAGKNVPIIMLTAKNDPVLKVRALNEGADDYVTKPFSFEELLARLKAIIRRPKEMVANIFRINGIEIDLLKQTAHRNKIPVSFTKKEMTLIALLHERKNAVVSRGIILEKVWDMDGDPFSNTVEVHIRNLRKKLGDINHKTIENVAGRGYKLNIP